MTHNITPNSSKLSQQQTTSKNNKKITKKRTKYSKVTKTQKNSLFYRIFTQQKSIKQASQELNINYSTAKTILFLHRQKLLSKPGSDGKLGYLGQFDYQDNQQDNKSQSTNESIVIEKEDFLKCPGTEYYGSQNQIQCSYRVGGSIVSNDEYLSNKNVQVLKSAQSLGSNISTGHKKQSPKSFKLYNQKHDKNQTTITGSQTLQKQMDVYSSIAGKVTSKHTMIEKIPQKSEIKTIPLITQKNSSQLDKFKNQENNKNLSVDPSQVIQISSLLNNDLKIAQQIPLSQIQQLQQLLQPFALGHENQQSTQTMSQNQIEEMLLKLTYNSANIYQELADRLLMMQNMINSLVLTTSGPMGFMLQFMLAVNQSQNYHLSNQI